MATCPPSSCRGPPPQVEAPGAVPWGPGQLGAPPGRPPAPVCRSSLSCPHALPTVVCLPPCRSGPCVGVVRPSGRPLLAAVPPARLHRRLPRAGPDRSGRTRSGTQPLLDPAVRVAERPQARCAPRPAAHAARARRQAPPPLQQGMLPLGPPCRAQRRHPRELERGGQAPEAAVPAGTARKRTGMWGAGAWRGRTLACMSRPCWLGPLACLDAQMPTLHPPHPTPPPA